MARMICHVGKYGSGSIADLDRHIGIATHAADIKVVNPEYSEKNAWGFPFPHKNLQHSILTRISARTNPEHAVRKDAVVLCEVLVTLIFGWTEELAPDEIRRFFQTSASFLCRRYHEENCMYSVMHIDERFPHLHFGFVPMTVDGRLSAKRLIDRIELRRLQTELPDHLRANGFQLGRGADADIDKSKQNDKDKRDTLRFQMYGYPSRDPVAHAENPREFSDLHRENHNLRLEKLLLERQMKRIIDTIKSDPDFEALYMRQLELQTQTDLDRHGLYALDKSG